MEIKIISEEIHANALKKGFWEDDNLSQKLLLIVTEVSEACEADRKDHHSDIIAFNKRVDEITNSIQNASPVDIESEYARLYKHYVKDSFEAEMAGTIIRCFDLCKRYKIDIEAHIAAEHRYNLTRPYKHNKNY